jgi:DedD protein
VTELTQHDAEDGFHEIQLSGKQVVFAFMLTTAAAVFIFLLGVQVGRNARTSAHADEPIETSAAAAPSAASPVPQAQQTAPASTSAPAGEVPPPPKEGADHFSYPKLQDDKAPTEKLKANADSNPAAPAQPAAPAASTMSAAAPKETPKPASAPAAADPAPSKSAAPSGRPGVWVVQLVALKDRAAAAAVVQRLSAKGYPAFVVNPSAGAPSIYRVQVGRYNDRREAEQVARRLEKEEQFKPWISH